MANLKKAGTNLLRNPYLNFYKFKNPKFQTYIYRIFGIMENGGQMNKDELLNRTLEELGKRYPQGLYEFLFKHRPDLYRQLVGLEDKIDQTYLNANASIYQFKAVLREYWTFHMIAIKEFKQVGQLEMNVLINARQEMEEERIRA